MSPGSDSSPRPTLGPSDLGTFVNLDSCPQYFTFHIQNDDEVLDSLDHEKPHFVEAFRGGNIIEKKAGNEFEEDVVNVIQEHITEFYDVEELTLAMVTTALPEQIRALLPEPENEIPGEALINGDFTYYGVRADNIYLDDAEQFIETVSDINNGDCPFDEEQIKHGFIELQIAYTEKLFGDLVTHVDTRDSHQELDYLTPRVETDVNASSDSDRPETDPIVLFQPRFSTEIGVWKFTGDADIILIWPTEDDTSARIRVIDVKLADEEKPHHQIQTVTYSWAIADLDTIDPSNINLETGVLTQQDDYLPLTPEQTPEFDRESRETDLRRLTKENGVLDTLFKKDYEETSYQLDSKCSSCQYNEVCYTMAIENSGLELLGINRGIQRTLEKHGIEDLNDLAALARPVDEDCHPKKDPKPRKVKEHAETYDALATIPGLGERLPQLIQKAQALLQDLNPDHDRVNETMNAPHITNSGFGEIPTDSWPPSASTLEGYREGSMIRVYMNIQRDTVRGSLVALGFHVRATASTTEPISYAVLDTELVEDPVEAHKNEVKLLEEFVDELFTAIQRVGRGIILDGYEQEDPFLHFFTYTEEEKRMLEERLALYSEGTTLVSPQASTAGIAPRAKPPTGNDEEVVEVDVSDSLMAFRSLLGHRDGADQEMITAVAPDIDARTAVRRPTTGLVNIYTEFYPKYRTEEHFKRSDWKYTPKDPARAPNGESEIDLTDVFSYRFFNNRVQYVRDGDSIRLLHDPSSREHPDGWYESRVRTGGQIPLAYLWAAGGKITDEWVAEAKESDADFVITPYRYHDSDDQGTEITDEDVEALMKRMCECLRHVEQGIPKRTRIYPTSPTSETEDGGEEV